jgi:hypothetical protein
VLWEVSGAACVDVKHSRKASHQDLEQEQERGNSIQWSAEVKAQECDAREIVWRSRGVLRCLPQRDPSSHDEQKTQKPKEDGLEDNTEQS